MRHFQEPTTILNAASTQITGKSVMVSDFQHIEIGVFSANSANFTLKIQGSNQVNSPDFSSAASPTNQWTYVQVIDLIDQSVVNGATGIVTAGTDIARQLEINTNAFRWVAATITAISAGNVTVVITPYGNE